MPIARWLTTAAALALVAGCAQRPASLDQAQTALQTARADQDVTTYAAAELDAAQTQLQSANQAWEDGEGATRRRIAPSSRRSQVEIARAAAQSRKSQAEVAELGGQRDKVLRQAAEAQVDTLQQQLASLQAKQTERGIVLTVGDVLFDVGQATLKPGAVNEIVRLAQFLAGESGAQGAHRGPYRQHRLDHHQPGAVAAPRRVGGGYARGRRGRARSHRDDRPWPRLPGREQRDGGRPAAEPARRGGDRECAGQHRLR